METKGNDQKRELSDAEIAAIAKQVAKNLKTKELKGIGATLAKSLKPADFWAIGKGLAKSPFVIGVAVIGIALACLAAYKAVPGVVKEKFEKVFNAKLTNEIVTQFAEPRISNIVVSVASSQASNMMAKQIAPEIAKFQSGLAEVMTASATNIFANTIYEEFHGTDTNRFFACLIPTKKFTNQVYGVCLKLKAVPMHGSVQATIKGGSAFLDFIPKHMDDPDPTRRNVLIAAFQGDWHLEQMIIVVQYVRDWRETNLVQKIKLDGGIADLDGELVEILQH